MSWEFSLLTAFLIGRSFLLILHSVQQFFWVSASATHTFSGSLRVFFIVTSDIYLFVCSTVLQNLSCALTLSYALFQSLPVPLYVREVTHLSGLRHALQRHFHPLLSRGFLLVAEVGRQNKENRSVLLPSHGLLIEKINCERNRYYPSQKATFSIGFWRELKCVISKILLVLCI